MDRYGHVHLTVQLLFTQRSSRFLAVRFDYGSRNCKVSKCTVVHQHYMTIVLVQVKEHEGRINGYKKS